MPARADAKPDYKGLQAGCRIAFTPPGMTLLLCVENMPARADADPESNFCKSAENGIHAARMMPLCAFRDMPAPLESGKSLSVEAGGFALCCQDDAAIVCVGIHPCADGDFSYLGFDAWIEQQQPGNSADVY